MPSSSSERSSTTNHDAIDAALTLDEVEVIVELRKRNKWTWLSWLSVAVGGCSVVWAVLDGADQSYALVVGIALLVTGSMNLEPRYRQAVNLLEKYVAQDPAAQDKLAMLDGSRFRERLEAGEYKQQPTPNPEP